MLSLFDTSGEGDKELSEMVSNVPWWVWVLIVIGLLGLVGFIFLFKLLANIGQQIAG